MRKALYFLGVLDDVDIQWIASNGLRKFVNSGDALITEGQPIESLFILLDGNLSVTAGVQNKQLALLKSGEVIGEISFIDSRPPSASVRASENSHVLAIPREILKRKLDRDIGFAARFYNAVALYLADRLRVTSSRLGYGDASQDFDADELDFAMMDNASIAATRFDSLLRQLQEPTSSMRA